MENENSTLPLADLDNALEPVILFVDRLIQEAISKKISDIHIEPFENCCRIRFRRDGFLYEAATIPQSMAAQVTTRLKVMAMLNIAERRLPQDGRIQLRQQQNNIDMRINTCPTLFGEKIVLRLLDYEQKNLRIDELGMHPTQQELFLLTLSQSQGLILVTGPTGSGKTITLYAALQHLNRIEKNIITIEDPVEIELNGIMQVNINPKIGFTFASALHAFLRQDPDIIMVGEIRDKETAEIALQAAQTGHLVLATLHTNSAAETITRFQTMGISSHHLVHSISLIIAQRLIRKSCQHCKQYGCSNCSKGYQGRAAIFELLLMRESLRRIILKGASAQDILDYAKQENIMLLYEAGLEKVNTGLTNHAELIRVLGNKDVY